MRAGVSRRRVELERATAPLRRVYEQIDAWRLAIRKAESDDFEPLGAGELTTDAVKQFERFFGAMEQLRDALRDPLAPGAAAVIMRADHPNIGTDIDEMFAMVWAIGRSIRLNRSARAAFLKRRQRLAVAK